MLVAPRTAVKVPDESHSESLRWIMGMENPLLSFPSVQSLYFPLVV